MKLLDPTKARSLLERIRALIAAGEIQLFYRARGGPAPEPAYVREVAQIKRLLERWMADAAFRERLEAEPRAAAESLGLSLDLDAIRPLWHEEAALATPAEAMSLSALRYRAYILEKLTYRNNIRADHPEIDRRFAAYRERQMRRTEKQIRPHANMSIVHAPFCIELCEGCSVGCWFCGVAAPRLEDIFAFTPENAALFTGVIETLKELLGGATGRGFCYWATDPLDNPDYERFMVEFHRVTGFFPQTTTALALKDIARTRALLELSRGLGGMINRFSLLTLRQLEQVHREFSPEELIHVELITQNREGQQAKAKAGRALIGRKPRAEASRRAGDQVAPGTIACVSGFLINMVKGTVKLISPCEADERWPLGYIVYGEGTFTTAAEFRAVIGRLVDENMQPTLRGADPVAFHDYLHFEERPDGIALKTAMTTSVYSESQVFSAIGRVIRGEARTVDQVVGEVTARDGIEPAEVLYALNFLANDGVLDTTRRAARPAGVSA